MFLSREWRPRLPIFAQHVALCKHQDALHLPSSRQSPAFTMESPDLTTVEPSTPLNQYKYRPVQPKDEIRILILLPPASPDESELHCDLETAELSDNPPYEAISYCWGAEVFPETLHLPNGTLAITENLAAALRRFRCDDHPRRLWADAVCINQHDIVEKGHQVALMGDIYRNAECVLIWLGEGSPKVRAGIVAIRELARAASGFGILYENVHTHLVEVYSKLLPDNGATSEFLLELSIKLDFSSIHAFASQDWFQRLWIVQEYCLATKLEIHNGCDILYEEDLSLATALLIQMIEELGSSLKWRGNLREFIVLLTTRIALHRSKYALNFPALIQLQQTRLCKLDQDRVYGLLALNTSDLAINYGLSADEVFTELALAYLRDNDLGILHYARRGEFEWLNSLPPHLGPTTDSHEFLFQRTLPSWVPDCKSEIS
jgi:Heterokaryon incompatibility protein (HET)